MASVIHNANPLGQKTDYISEYNPSLLFSIPRNESRNALNIGNELPFYGVDIWTGYELSWLNSVGKPEVAVAEFVVPCTSPFIIESKSFKLYLNSLNQTKFESSAQLAETISKDLSSAAGAKVQVGVQPLLDQFISVNEDFTRQHLNSQCLDNLNIEANVYHPEPAFLVVDEHINVTENLHSHLLKTNCPVTGQPDWASVFIAYCGKRIVHENLLKYLISFREHQDFHEHCVERIFTDILARCKPSSLSVYARYTRRGGLDINPFRSTQKEAKPRVGRLVRQ